MKRFLTLVLVPTLAVAFAARPAPAAPAQSSLDNIQVTYHGGPLLQRVRVITLFWGPSWKQSPLPAYFNNFFKTLFTDGRFMANLAQYSTTDYTVENGLFAGTYTDPVTPADAIEDTDIQAEVRALIAAGHLRAPDDNTLYFVFTPPKVVVTGPRGIESNKDFSGYHSDAAGSTRFSYAVIPYDDNQGTPELMTDPASHELAEAVTDPRPLRRNAVGWYDDNNGEIADIPLSLLDANRLTEDDVWTVLDGLDGSRYLVQKFWSVHDGKPVAFEGG